VAVDRAQQQIAGSGLVEFTDDNGHYHAWNLTMNCPMSELAICHQLEERGSTGEGRNHKVLAYSYLFAIFDKMREHRYLGEFELILLLTIIGLGDDAYGVPLSRELSQLRGRNVSIGSVYAALDRLELKGLITSSLGESSPERGGRAKRYFRVTEEGLLSVKETRRVLTKLWKVLPSTGGDLV